MLGKEIIMQELTRVDLAAKSTDDVFEQMAADLLRLGYVNDTYLPSIKQREAEYPTALPIEPHPIAIPHTSATAINKPFIAPVRLKEPVEWGDMADAEIKHKVRFVFLLGFKEAEAHIELLQILVYNFQQQEWMQQLMNAKNVDEFYEAVASMEWRYE